MSASHDRSTQAYRIGEGRHASAQVMVETQSQWRHMACRTVDTDYTLSVLVCFIIHHLTVKSTNVMLILNNFAIPIIFENYI